MILYMYDLNIRGGFYNKHHIFKKTHVIEGTLSGTIKILCPALKNVIYIAKYMSHIIIASI